MKNKNDWYHETDRFDKLEYIQETTTPEWFNNHFINELVTWMGEDDFNKFFKDQLVRYWEFKTPYELNEEMEIACNS